MSNDPYEDLDEQWANRALKHYANFTEHPIRTVAYVVGSIIALCLVLTLIGNALGIANIYWQAEQAKLTVKPRVTQATYDTNNVLHNISYFHDQCNTILTDQQNVLNAQATLKSDQKTFNAISDPIAQQQAGQSVTQDQTNTLGAKDQLSNDVRDYDSKSATQTANPFKAHNLPYRINLNSSGLIKGQISCH